MLQANGYNPNVVLKTELELLEFSVLKTGWIQPILVSRDYVIIDGFHRFRSVCDSLTLELGALRKSLCPCSLNSHRKP